MWFQCGACGRSKYCNSCIVPSQKRSPVHFSFFIVLVKCDFSCIFCTLTEERWYPPFIFNCSCQMWCQCGACGRSKYCNNCVIPSQKLSPVHFDFNCLCQMWFCGRSKYCNSCVIFSQKRSPVHVNCLCQMWFQCCACGRSKYCNSCVIPSQKRGAWSCAFCHRSCQSYSASLEEGELVASSSFFFLQNLYAEIIIIVMWCVCALYTYGILSFRLICIMWAPGIDGHILNVHY